MLRERFSCFYIRATPDADAASPYAVVAMSASLPLVLAVCCYAIIDYAADVIDALTAQRVMMLQWRRDIDDDIDIRCVTLLLLRWLFILMGQRLCCWLLPMQERWRYYCFSIAITISPRHAAAAAMPCRQLMPLSLLIFRHIFRLMPCHAALCYYYLADRCCRVFFIILPLRLLFARCHAMLLYHIAAI